MNIKSSECLSKSCFIPGLSWGHLSNQLCEHLGEDDKGCTCNKPLDKVTMRRERNQLIIDALVAYTIDKESMDTQVCSVNPPNDEFFICYIVARNKMPCTKCRMMYNEPDVQIMY